jgi:hypothetical protein
VLVSPQAAGVTRVVVGTSVVVVVAAPRFSRSSPPGGVGTAVVTPTITGRLTIAISPDDVLSRSVPNPNLAMNITAIMTTAIAMTTCIALTCGRPDFCSFPVSNRFSSPKGTTCQHTKPTEYTDTSQHIRMIKNVLRET